MKNQGNKIIYKKSISFYNMINKKLMKEIIEKIKLFKIMETKKGDGDYLVGTDTDWETNGEE